MTPPTPILESCSQKPCSNIFCPALLARHIRKPNLIKKENQMRINITIMEDSIPKSNVYRP
jgi:hypothetical protein